MLIYLSFTEALLHVMSTVVRELPQCLFSLPVSHRMRTNKEVCLFGRSRLLFSVVLQSLNKHLSNFGIMSVQLSIPFFLMFA